MILWGPFFDGESIDIYLDSTGSYVLTEADIVIMFGTLTDNSNSEVVNFGAYPLEFDCIHIEPKVIEVPIVQLVARDIYGNESKEWVPITVLDTLSPKIDAVSDMEIELEAGSCDSAVSITYPEIIASDNCGFELEQVAGLGADGIFPIGNTTEIWVATDKSGNTDTLTFMVKVTLANAAPTIDDIADIEVDEDSGPVVVEVSGISYGIDCREQGISLFAGIDSVLVDSVSIAYSSGDSMGTVNFYLAPDMFGDTILSVGVRDSWEELHGNHSI